MKYFILQYTTMTCEEIKIDWFTDEDLMKVQENLSPADFQMFLEQMRDFHQLQIADDFLDVPETDPMWYSIE